MSLDLDRSLTFARLAVDPNIRFARSLGIAGAESLGMYNPLFFVGGRAEQQRHLLNAIGNLARANHGRIAVRCFPYDGFTSDHDVAVLLVADGEALGYEQTRAFVKTGTQVVVTSEVRPSWLSAGRMGIEVRLEPPSAQTCRNVVEMIASRDRLRLPSEVYDLIATRVTGTVWQLDCALHLLAARANLHRSPILESHVDEVIPEFPPAELTVERITHTVSDYFNVDFDELRGHVRSRIMVQARQIALYLCRQLTDLPSADIANAFGGRDFTTSLHANRKLRQLLPERRPTYNQVTELLSLLCRAATDPRDPRAEEADSRERMARLAIADRRYDDARTDIRHAIDLDPSRARRFGAELTGLLGDHPPDDEFKSQRTDWVCGLWAGMMATFDYSWPHQEGAERLQPDAPIEKPDTRPVPSSTAAATAPSETTGQPHAIGRKLEDVFVDVIRNLFEIPVGDGQATLAYVRRQSSGTQFGHDIEFEVRMGGGIVRCHVECKNHQRVITIDDIAPKVIMNEDRWRDTRIDHLIIVSPHSNAANGLGTMLRNWSETRRYPFDVTMWSPENHVEELFRLVPHAYASIYGRAPAPLGRDEEAGIAARWRARLQPVIRLPRSWVSYLSTPTEHDLSGEDAEHLEQLRTTAMTLLAAEENGAQLPGTLHSNVADWLADSSQRSLLLLAEFGEGKSFFCYQLAAELAQRYLTNPTKGWIPLSLPLRAFRQETNMRGVLARRLAEIGITAPEWRRVATSGAQTLVILDGFDEMSTRMDPSTLSASLRALQDCFEMFPTSKILITSRTHFFEHVDDRQRFLDHTGRPRVLRIAPVTRQSRLEHLETYAEYVGAGAQLAQLKRLHDPIGIAKKPLFLQMIKDVLPTLDVGHFDELTLYQRHIQQSLERKWHDLRDELSTLTDDRLMENLQVILEELAVRLHTSDQHYINLREFTIGGSSNLAEVLWRMASAPNPGTGHTDSIKADPTDASDARSRVGIRSLLKPVYGDDADRWPVAFFHRSIREYFVAQALVRAIAANDDRATELLACIPLQPEITNFAVKLMRTPDKCHLGISTTALAGVLQRIVRSSVMPQATGQHLGGNAITLLYALEGNLPGSDWSGLSLDFAHLAGADLTGMSFRGSSLTHANLDNADLTAADFRQADLTGVQLEQTAPVVDLTLNGDDVIAAYSDRTLRRWSVSAGGRVTSDVVGEVDFRPLFLAVSPFGDLIVTGAHCVAILRPIQADARWRTVSRFEIRSDLRGISFAQHLVAVQRRMDDLTVLHIYDPAAGHVLDTLSTPARGTLQLLGRRHAVSVDHNQIELTVWQGINSHTPRVHRLPFPQATSLAVHLVDEHVALLFSGHRTGEICLRRLNLAGAEPELTELWTISAHAAPVTAVSIGTGFAASASMDRTVCLFPLVDLMQIGEPHRLHRTLLCDGMLIDDVRGPREQELLTRIRDHSS